jgi:hypothetical protein
MKAMIKNRNDYEFIDFIYTSENRNKTKIFVDFLLFAQARYGFSNSHGVLKDHKITIIYDDKLEIIYPVS